jgi:hypothetical protein
MGISDPKQLKYDSYAVREIMSKRVSIKGKGPKVVRESLQSSLGPIIGRNTGQYHVVIGPRGSGKSTAVHQACSGKEGIASIRISKTDLNVFEEIAKSFGVFSPHRNFSNQDDLVKLFNQASEMKGGGWVPTIICEIDRGTSADTVAMVAKDLKVLFLVNLR